MRREEHQCEVNISVWLHWSRDYSSLGLCAHTHTLLSQRWSSEMFAEIAINQSRCPAPDAVISFVEYCFYPKPVQRARRQTLHPVARCDQLTPELLARTRGNRRSNSSPDWRGASAGRVNPGSVLLNSGEGGFRPLRNQCFPSLGSSFNPVCALTVAFSSRSLAAYLF